MTKNFPTNTQATPVPSTALLTWLTYSKSLTVRLEQFVPVELIILQQGKAQRTWWEMFALNIQEPLVFRREILIKGQEKPCWYARSVVPWTTYTRYPSFFKRLDQESLGKLVFDNPEVKRQALHHFSVTPKNIEYHWLQPQWHHHAHHLWARFSQFVIADDAPFYLVEILLPSLEEIPLEA